MTLFPAIVAAMLAGGSPAADPLSSSPWKVASVREPRADEVPFETTTNYLRIPEGRNYCPGPDSLVAQVTIEKRRGYLELVNTRAQTTTRLLSFASLPAWSPDGRLLSCSAWTPERRMGKLTVIDVASRKEIADVKIAVGNDSKWSPDSRMIAADGVSYIHSGTVLYLLSVPSNTVTVIDSLDVIGSYVFSWSPDSRWIAFSRPIKTDHWEEPMEADLWIADARSGDAWRILQDAGWVIWNPLWITNESIEVERSRYGGEGEEPKEHRRVVVELAPAN